MACLWALVGAGLVVAYALPWLLHPPAQGLDVCYGGRLWEVETVVLMALVPQGIAARIEPRWAGPTSASTRPHQALPPPSRRFVSRSSSTPLNCPPTLA
jgi:hypothetical protein